MFKITFQNVKWETSYKIQVWYYEMRIPIVYSIYGSYRCHLEVAPVGILDSISLSESLSHVAPGLYEAGRNSLHGPFSPHAPVYRASSHCCPCLAGLVVSRTKPYLLSTSDLLPSDLCIAKVLCQLCRLPRKSILGLGR